MKIGIYISGINEKSGGAYTFEQNILDSLLKFKDNEDIYIFSNSDDERFRNTKINYIKLEERKPRLPSSKLISRWIRKLSKKLKINQAEENSQYFISSLDWAVKYHKIGILWYATQYFEPVDIPYIYTVWDLNHRIYPFFPEVSANKMWVFREELYKNIVPRAAYVLTGTETGKQEIIKFYNVLEERIKVLPFPAPKFEDTDILNAQNYNLKDDFDIQNDYLIYPAAFHPHKNHIRILEALIILEKKYGLKYGAVFFGSDCENKNYLKAKCQEFNLQDRVKFFNFVPRDQLIYLYKHAFALVYASYFGPDNIPPLEAFSLKCPVIASRVFGTEEQLSQKAILVNPDNAEDFASAVVKLAKNIKFRKQMVARAFNHANNWTFDDYTTSVLSLINEFFAIRSCWGDNLNNYYKNQLNLDLIKKIRL